ncbi:hypothetical protein Bbelb_327750 [Branchiostoma belcheri]|nr:hypothetical protein Bbelb_327750 [Branchiostoma belcheri]
MGDNEEKQVVGCYGESDRRFEDVDPAGYSTLASGSGLQRTAPNGPPPRHLDMKDNEKDEFGIRNEESDRNYKDVDPAGESICEETGEMGEDMSGGVDVIINSGLKRPVPDLPTPRNSDAGDRMAEDKPSEEPCSDPCYEQVDNAGHNAGAWQLLVITLNDQSLLPNGIPDGIPNGRRSGPPDGVL